MISILKKFKGFRHRFYLDLELLDGPQSPNGSHQAVPLWAGPFPLWEVVSSYQKPSWILSASPALMSVVQ